MSMEASASPIPALIDEALKHDYSANYQCSHKMRVLLKKHGYALLSNKAYDWYMSQLINHGIPIQCSTKGCQYRRGAHEDPSVTQCVFCYSGEKAPTPDDWKQLKSTKKCHHCGNDMPDLSRRKIQRMTFELGNWGDMGKCPDCLWNGRKIQDVYDS